MVPRRSSTQAFAGAGIANNEWRGSTNCCIPNAALKRYGVDSARTRRMFTRLSVPVEGQRHRVGHGLQRAGIGVEAPPMDQMPTEEPLASTRSDFMGVEGFLQRHFAHSSWRQRLKASSARAGAGRILGHHLSDVQFRVLRQHLQDVPGTDGLSAIVLRMSISSWVFLSQRPKSLRRCLRDLARVERYSPPPSWQLLGEFPGWRCGITVEAQSRKDGVGLSTLREAGQSGAMTGDRRVP